MYGVRLLFIAVGGFKVSPDNPLDFHSKALELLTVVVFKYSRIWWNIK